jgi:hypothetical protein
MAKNKWTIEKFKEMDQNLFIQVFDGDDLIYNNLQNNNAELLFGKIKKLYSLDLFEYKNKISHRITKSGYYQNWHIDGRRIFELRSGIVCPSNPNSNNKYQIHNIYNPVPTYSILYYGSNYNQDFKGGSIEFINGTIIKPTKNMCIIFDSDLAHRVNLQTSGERKVSLIMLFR